MTIIAIKDLHDEVRELTDKEMDRIKGGAGPDIGGFDTMHEIVHGIGSGIGSGVDAVTKPIDVGSAIRNGHW